MRTAVTVLAGFLACGIPLWPIPYQKVSMPGNPSASIWLLLGALAGGLGAWLMPAKLGRPMGGVALGFALAVIARVAVETQRDPTSHNLWPFEVVIATTIGTIAAIMGVASIRLIRRVARSRT